MTEKHALKVHKKLKLQKLYDPIMLESNEYVKKLGSLLEEVRRLYLKIIIDILIAPKFDMYLFNEYFKLWFHKVGFETQEPKLLFRKDHYFQDVISRTRSISREYKYIWHTYRSAWSVLFMKFFRVI